jgi:hypothetical protein
MSIIAQVEGSGTVLPVTEKAALNVVMGPSGGGT